MSEDVDGPRTMAILAGGSNARMEALRGTIYKAFLPIHGLSCVARHIIRAAAFGIAHVTVMADVNDPALRLLAQPAELEGGPQVEVVEHDGSPSEKIVSWYRSLGVGAKALVVVGDTLAPVDLTALWHSTGNRFDSALALARVRLPFSVVEVQDDRVLSVTENPITQSYANTGHMVLGPSAVQYMARGADLITALGRTAAEGRLKAVLCDGPFTAVDSLSGLAAAHLALPAQTSP